MKYIPYKEVGPFRVGDIIDFDGVFGMLTECFDFRYGKGKYGPVWAWRVTTVNPNEHIDGRHYSGDQYGISAINLYNIWKSKLVARGPDPNGR